MPRLSAARAALRRRYRPRASTRSQNGTPAHVATASEPTQDEAVSVAELRPREPPVNGPGEVTITPYRDGPYLLRGPFILRDQDGEEIPNARRVVALCRCGKSRTRPFCDGTHRLVDFHAPSGSERPVDLAPAAESA
jgi:CDGSH-type Zn-finger protein